MQYVIPRAMVALDDLTVLYVPGLESLIQPMLADPEVNLPGFLQSQWSIVGWDQSVCLALEVKKGEREFGVALIPRMWEPVITQVMQTGVIGLITDRKHIHEDGSVTPFTISEATGVLEPTMLKVYGVDTGLKKITGRLDEILEKWNPHGALTYLRHILSHSPVS